jgi:NAD(P)-dependent dehydrogenase (short-subunit alcohol dehydrogenase family)
MIILEQDFTGKSALITGAGTGMGAATARHLAARGAKVALVGIDAEHVATVCREIEAAGGTALDLAVDVSAPQAVEAAVQRAVAAFGGLHFGVNCAGIACPWLATGEIEPADWLKVINVNLDGVFYSMRYEIPAILNSGGGAIVNISSVWFERGYGGRASYTAAKHGVAGLTRAAANEYARQNLRVNSVAPGIIDTPMIGTDSASAAAVANTTPMGRIGRPEEIADAVAFLLSDRASYISGVVLPVDGAFLA